MNCARHKWRDCSYVCRMSALVLVHVKYLVHSFVICCGADRVECHIIGSFPKMISSSPSPKPLPPKLQVCATQKALSVQALKRHM